MGRLVFIGLGLNSEESITLQGLHAAKSADKVYLETYTNLMPELSLERLEQLIGKPVCPLWRRDVEDSPEESILKDAASMNVALLVSGDPMSATTHVDLRLRAVKGGIPTAIVSGVSVVTAAAATVGLQVYKFSRTVTLPFTSEKYMPETPYWVVMENMERGLHSLVLLDLDVEAQKYMSIREGLQYLLTLEARLKKGIITMDTFTVGVARIGSESATARADSIDALLTHDFGPPPHLIIFPGKLHFMETEALKAFARAPATLQEFQTS
ncbi:MAG: diphthine synthase [Candidatus Bathyarchaeia archaeon]